MLEISSCTAAKEKKNTQIKHKTCAFLLPFICPHHRAFLAIQGHYWVTKSSRVPISQSQGEKNPAGLRPAFPHTQRAAARSEIHSSLPKRESRFGVTQVNSALPLSTLQHLKTMLLMCMVYEKKGKFSARQRSLQTWVGAG